MCGDPFRVGKRYGRLPTLPGYPAGDGGHVQQGADHVRLHRFVDIKAQFAPGVGVEAAGGLGLALASLRIRLTGSSRNQVNCPRNCEKINRT